MIKTLQPLLAYGRGVVLESAKHGFADSEAIKAVEAIKRWDRQIETPYADLTESEKDSDRAWADKVSEITGTASPPDGAYAERAQCVAALVRLALGMGLPAGIAPATPDEWACAYIETPEGQVAWHVAETDLHHFDGIPPFTGDTSQTYTTDEKYRRLSLWAGRRNPDGSVRPIEGKEDLAQYESTRFLRYLQACGGHNVPFDLKAHLPRIQMLLDALDKSRDT
jgi:hypothetical protein